MKFVFLFLIVTCGVAAAQTPDKPIAVKHAEFGVAKNGYVKMTMDSFYTELFKDPSAQGVIINYGTENEIAVREKQILNAFVFRKYDSARVTIVRGGFWKTSLSEFWVVPAGADRPTPAKKATLFDKFGKMPDGEVKARLQNHFVELNSRPGSTLYILISAPQNIFALQKRRIEKFMGYMKLDKSRVRFIKSGSSTVIENQFWIITSEPEK